MTTKKLGLFVLAATTLALAACGNSTSSKSAATSVAPSTSSAGTSSAATSSKGTTSVPAASQSSSEPATSVPSTSEPATSTPTSSEPASSEPASSEPSSTSVAPVQSADLFYFDGTFTGPTGQGAEGTGKMVYWAGDGGTVSAASVSERTFSLTYTSTGNWYGVQIFYKLPYAELNDSYAFDFSFTSDVAGGITVNGAKVTLAAATALDYKATIAQGAGDTVSIQLGIDGTGVLAGKSFQMTVNSIKDNSATNAYYANNFVNGNEALKTIQVRSGKTVAAPANPTPATGKVFDGWYDGETKWASDLAITAAHTWTAKFGDASSAKTVTLMNGSSTLGTVSVVSGQAVAIPSTIAAPFGTAILGWYTDAALSSAYDLTTPVTADLTLYAKLGTQHTSVYSTGGLNALVVSRGTDGAEVFTNFTGAAGSNVWDNQINFAPIPVGEAGKNYKITFSYRVSAAGGDVKICDIGNGYATVGAAVTLSVLADYQTVELPFSGAAFSANTEVTFELGKLASSANKLEILDFSLVEVAA